MVAIGGWGDVKGFEKAARNEEGRKVCEILMTLIFSLFTRTWKIWAANVKRMVDLLGADGGCEMLSAR